MPARAHTKARARGANPVLNVATGGIAQRINGAIATERIRTTGRPVVLPHDPAQNDIVSTDNFPSLKHSIRLAATQKLAAKPKQQTAAPRRQTVLFAVQKKTRYGQTVRLVGDSSELGSWSMDNAIELLWGEGHEWHAHVQLPPGTHTFKFVLIDSEGCIEWEASENRHIEICPTTASTQYCTRWNSTKAETTSAPLLRRSLREPALSGAVPPCLATMNGTPPPSPIRGSSSASRPSSSGPVAGPSGRQESRAPIRPTRPSRESPATAGAPPSGVAGRPAGPAARGPGGASTSGRAAATPAAAAAAAAPAHAKGAVAKAVAAAEPRTLDMFAVCGIKGKMWKVDLGGVDNARGVFGAPATPPGSPPASSSSTAPSSSSSSRRKREQPPHAKAAAAAHAPAAAIAAAPSRRSSSSSLGDSTSASAASSAPSSRRTPSTPPSKPAPTQAAPATPHPRQQPRAVATKAATAVAAAAVAAAAAPPAPSPTQQPAPATAAPAAPYKATSPTQQVADARQKLQQLLGGSSAAAAAAAAAVASRRAVAAEEAAMMSALVVARPPPSRAARKLRPEERAALMRKAQYNSDEARLPAGAKPVVLEATVQQKMAMLFTGLITGDVSDMPLW